jgi:hypothetical protein
VVGTNHHPIWTWATCGYLPTHRKIVIFRIQCLILWVNF